MAKYIPASMIYIFRGVFMKENGEISYDNPNLTRASVGIIQHPLGLPDRFPEWHPSCQSSSRWTVSPAWICKAYTLFLCYLTENKAKSLCQWLPVVHTGQVNWNLMSVLDPYTGIHSWVVMIITYFNHLAKFRHQPGLSFHLVIHSFFTLIQVCTAVILLEKEIGTVLLVRLRLEARPGFPDLNWHCLDVQLKLRADTEEVEHFPCSRWIKTTDGDVELRSDRGKLFTVLSFLCFLPMSHSYIYFTITQW